MAKLGKQKTYLEKDGFLLFKDCPLYNLAQASANMSINFPKDAAEGLAPLRKWGRIAASGPSTIGCWEG